MLQLTSEKCPPAISTAFLDCLATKMYEDATINSLQGVSQREVFIKIDLKNLQPLTDHISELGVTKRHRKAGLLPHAGDWLNVVPSPALGLHLRPTLVSVKYRLGVNIFSNDGQCTVHSLSPPQ
jgi:hypothetical protein